ncbi:MAG: hypothetical protein AB7G93_19390 [Bdellovibrionales bacterium]
MIKNLAPDIMRQRLLIEGFYKIEVNPGVIERYFQALTERLSLKMYSKPIIFSPGGEGKSENQGYDAFVPLIDSGISVYIWSNRKFFSGIIYTCKPFDEQMAFEVTKRSFDMDDAVKWSF